MRNPWADLEPNDDDEWVLPQDRPHIDAINRRLHEGDERRIHYRGLIPEPWTGDPRTAAVITLLLKPGLVAADYPIHARESTRRPTLVDRLSHRSTGFDFADETMAGTPGYDWWWEAPSGRAGKVRELGEAAGRENLIRNFAAVDWFGYKSAKFSGSKRRIPSQSYTTELVNAAIDRGAWIVVPCNRRTWFEDVPALHSYSRALFTRSVMNTSLTPRNLQPTAEKFDDPNGVEAARLFDQLVLALID